MRDQHPLRSRAFPRLQAAKRVAGVQRTLVSSRIEALRSWWPPGPSAYKYFGTDSVIVPPARVEGPAHMSIGADVVVLEGAWLTALPLTGSTAPGLRIGNRSHIGRFCRLACVGSVVIGEDVLMSDHVWISDSHHRLAEPGLPIILQPMVRPRPVVVGDGSFVGIRAVILPGTTVGANAYIGAGAVVHRDVPARTVVVGNPARPVRTWDDAIGAWRRVQGWEDLGTPTV